MATPFQFGGFRLNTEKLQDAFADAMQTDWEHGVAWMNDAAADEFKKTYPTIWEVIRKVMMAEVSDDLD